MASVFTSVKENNRKSRKGKVCHHGIVMLLLFLFFAVGGSAEAFAAESTLRIISTTDTHNQLSVEYYDNAGERSKGSLAKLYTLIKEARASVATGASLTVDVGDTIYGYGSDYIYENHRDAVQPMYAAMAEMGYDALTLGNHEFDYGFSYIKEQIDKSGLSSICTVANVYDAITGNNIWKNYLMIKKQCLATDGKYYPVDIAVIGVTRPTLSNYSTHTGELVTEDMLEVVKEQAAHAKLNGADVVVVIAHTGIGTEAPAYLSENEGYAIAALSDVDAVMCGHLHLNFPSKDENASHYYDLADVDGKTGLIKGKPVIMIQDRAAGIGVADLKLKIAKDGAIDIVGASSNIIYAGKNTAEDPTVLKHKNLFDEQIKNTYKETFATLADGENIQNYFGYLEDNAAIQLNNECKIREGLLFREEKQDSYGNYPVIAAGSYKKAGTEGTDDYLTINGFLTMKDLLGIQTYNRDYVVIYRITGAQLKEWLEWTASAYGYWDSGDSFQDLNIKDIIKSNGVQSVLSSKWIENWKNFTIFDGVEYEFDMSVPPKYDRYGNVVNSSSSRVTKLTCNGQAVTSSMQLLLVTERGLVYNNPVVGSEILNQRVKNTTTYLVGKLKEYVTELSSYGNLSPSVEDNWNVTMRPGDNYLIRSSINSKQTAQSQSWYSNILAETEEYVYYQAKFTGEVAADTDGPILVAGSTNTVKTHRNIKIAVQATDTSGVSVLKYVKGQYAADDAVWSQAANITGTGFSVAENAVYSILAKDAFGNATVKYVTVSNYDSLILQVPEIKSYTNKKAALSGTTDPMATVYVTAGDVTYTLQADASGSFKCEMPYQKAGAVLSVYVMDAQGRRSDDVEVVVEDAGPNYPEVSELTNTSRYIKGKLNDESYCQIFAVIGSKVYVSEKGGREAYENSTKYSTSKTIVEAAYSESDGNFSLKIAVQDADKTIKVFSVDTIGRVSAVNEITVKGVAPNKPTLYKISDVETTLYGKIPGVASGAGIVTKIVSGSAVTSSAFTISIQAGTEVYGGVTDANGYFAIPVGELSAGTSITVTAADVVDGKVRTSAKASTEVLSCSSYVGEYGYIVFDEVTNKTTAITGRLLSAGYDTVYMKVGSDYHMLEVAADRSFRLELAEPLPTGTQIGAVIREKLGQLTDAAMITVKKSEPLKPTILTNTIYNTSKKVRILSEEKCTAYVKVGDNVFLDDSPEENVLYGGYIYEVKLKNISAREEIAVYMENSVGKSKKVFGRVKGKKPDIRSVKKITYKQKKLEGKVGLYLSPESGAANVTVNSTGTRVYAKTGGKTYEAKVKKDGTFKVKFPAKLPSGRTIKVWAVNDFGGKGKVTVVTVK